jgi:flagellar M-ring protein FliF
VGFEIFDKASFGVSDFVQRANYARAIQGELARTISQLDQVESARVMIVMPENRLLSDNSRKPTASVFVRVKGSAQLPASAINSIRFLVANSVEGLQANNVSVVDNQGNVLSENQENDSVAGLSNNQLSARRNCEQYLSKKAEGMLEKVLGPGQAVVRVAVDLNWDTISRTEENCRGRWRARHERQQRRRGRDDQRDVRGTRHPGQQQSHQEESHHQHLRDQQDNEQHPPGRRRGKTHLQRGLHRATFRRQRHGPQSGAANPQGTG